MKKIKNAGPLPDNDPFPDNDQNSLKYNAELNELSCN